MSFDDKVRSTSAGLAFCGFLKAPDVSLIRSAFADISLRAKQHVVMDFTEYDGMDTVAASGIYEGIRNLERAKIDVYMNGLLPRDQELLASFRRHEQSLSAPRRSWSLKDHFEGVGDDVVASWETARGLWVFSKNTFSALVRVLTTPSLFRWHLTFYYMEHAGVRAVPIVGTLCWLIGTVLGFQAGYQLKSFAAEMFMPDLIAYSITWEIGPLLAAILVAGRSSSAFAAEIGTMKVRQEIDALEVMGFNIFEYLVTPKMCALFLVMPALVLMADFFGLLGGLLIGGWYLDMPASYYLSRLNFVMLPIDFWWGMLKGLVFAVIIANVGCYMGMRVRGGAAEVGRATTAAVVTAIFLVIMADALISLIFMEIRPTVQV